MISVVTKLIMLRSYNKTIFSLEDFMKKFNLKDGTVNEIGLQLVYIHPCYPREFMITSDKRFTNIANE